jgi:hypothetical protein
VLVPVNVTDPLNRFVAGLEERDFQIFEDGDPMLPLVSKTIPTESGASSPVWWSSATDPSWWCRLRTIWA